MKQERGVWLPPQVWGDSRLTPTEKIICAEIGNYCHNGGSFYKSNETIAQEMNISPSTVKRAINTLEQMGHIQREPFDGRRRELRVSDPSLWPNMTQQPGQNDPADRSKWSGRQVKMNRQPVQNEPADRSKRPTIIKEELKKKKESKKKKEQVVMPWPQFDEVWQTWTQYKSDEHRFKYKSEHSEQLAVNELAKISNNDPERARAIIRQSITHGWKGLYPIKSGAGAPAPSARTTDQDAEQFANFIRTGNL